MFFAIIVTYYPNVSHVMGMCKALREAGIGVVIFDNTPDNITSSQMTSLVSETFRNDNNINFIGDGVNLGLGVAFNRSVKHVLNSHADAEGFLFFDQDSTLTPEKLSALVGEYYQLKEKNIHVGVFGALPVDDKGDPYWVRKSKSECTGIKNENYICADFVISSFSLVPKSTFEKVGFFDEKLFIDLVDSEFSYRCTKYGFLNIVSRNVRFLHVIGDKRGGVLGRSFAISSPLRNYYQIRNLILVGRDYGWYYFIASKVFKRFIQIILSSLHDHSFLLRIKFFSKGIYDGVLYKGGAYDKKNSNKLIENSRIVLENSISPHFLFDDTEYLGFDCLESALKLSKRNFNLDENAMAFFLRFGFLPPPYTGLKDVGRKSFLSTKKFVVSQELKNNFPWKNYHSTKSYNFDEFNHHFLKALRSTIDINKKYLLMLSGGKDSTAILLGLAEIGIKNLKCTTYVSGIKEDESTDARKMCDALGYEHITVIKDTKKEFDLTLDCLQKSISPVADPAFPAYLHVLDKISSVYDFDIVIDGMGNDIYMGHMPPKRETQLQKFSLPSLGLSKFWGLSDGGFYNSYSSYLVQSLLMYKTERMFSGSRLSISNILRMKFSVDSLKNYVGTLEGLIKDLDFISARALIRGGIYDDLSGCEKARVAAYYCGKEVVFPFMNNEFSDYFYSLQENEKFDADKRINKVSLRKYIQQMFLNKNISQNEYLKSKGSFRFDVTAFVVNNKGKISDTVEKADDFTNQHYSFNKVMKNLMSNTNDYTASLQVFLLFSLCGWISDVNKKPFNIK